FRAMNKAAENVYTALRRDGTQKNVIDTMQTRMELYDAIGYHAFEQSLDALFAQKKGYACAGLIAGKPAPTGTAQGSSPARNIVGAGLPAIGPVQPPPN